jgi:TIR domain
VRLFVSYSRSDAQFVRRLTEALEVEGHDVWVDTEDIVGSEQWRASIVGGVQRADAVLLVVSPRSMASPNVEREITLAAEESRRIVPLVLEPAEMTGSILFELAGSQQISFAGREFDIAMEELRNELRMLPTDPRRGSPLVSPTVPAREFAAPEAATSRRDNRRLAAVAVVIVGLVAGVIYVVAGGGDDEGTPGSPQTAATLGDLTEGSATATDLLPLADVALDATVWFAGFEIVATRATFDPVAGVVEVPVTFTNDALGAADPLGMLQSGSGALEWSGGRLTAFCSCSTQLPPGDVLSATIEFDTPADFDLTGSVFVLGGATQHQARIPLDGGASTSDQPVAHNIQGQIDDGAGTTFTIERVRVVPAECFGLASDLMYVPGSVDRVSVEVVGSTVYTGPGNVNFGDATLLLPDGTRIGSASLASSVYALSPNQPQHDIGVCFSVPAPPAGSYTLIVTAANIDPDPPGFSFQL